MGPAACAGAAKLTHPGDALGQIMHKQAYRWPHPWCRFCARDVFSSPVQILLLPLALSVFQLRPAKDNASSQLPTLLLISLVLKLQPTLVLPFYTLVNVLNVHLSEAPAIRTEVTIQYD